MSDWIKIHRSILDSYCFANPVSFKIWAWMLLKANYKQGFVPLKVGKGFITVKIERGQFIFGRHAAEKELNIDGSAIYRTIQKFEELEQIIIEPNSQYSIITICNYDTYQNKQDIDEQPTNNQRTGNEQPTNNTRTTPEHKEEELEEKESKEYNPLGEKSGVVFEMAKIFKKYNPLIEIVPTEHYGPCLQIAYRIAAMKGWKEQDVINGKMGETLKSWEKIVLFVKSDSWLATRSLIDLNNQKEWDRLVNKMKLSQEEPVKKEPAGSPIKKESEVDFEKYKKKH